MPVAAYGDFIGSLPPSLKSFIITDTRITTLLDVTTVMLAIRSAPFKLEYLNIARNRIVSDCLAPVVAYLLSPEGSSLQWFATDCQMYYFHTVLIML